MQDLESIADHIIAARVLAASNTTIGPTVMVALDDALGLHAEVKRLRAMVKEAYFQGYADGRHRSPGADSESLWSGSEIANRLGYEHSLDPKKVICELCHGTGRIMAYRGEPSQGREEITCDCCNGVGEIELG